MKKFVKANARIIIGIIAAIIIICVCASACNNNGTAENTENLSQGNIHITEENSNAQGSADNEVIANDVELQKGEDDLSTKLEAALKENESLKAENAELKKENSSLEAQTDPAVEVIDGVVYCDVDYFLSRTTVKFADDTAALMAISSGTRVVLDDVHAIGQTAGYRDETFNLPREGYNLAVTFDGKEVMIADFSNYHWASNSLFLKSNATTGYKLVETYKSSSMGNFDLLLNIVAVCVENSEAEYGYDFYVAANYNDPNPVVSKPETQPECPKEETDDVIDLKPVEPNDPEEPEDPKDPEKPDDPKDPEKPGEPENNPPIDEPVIPEDPEVPGEPENNPPLDETEDVPEGEGPEDMQDGPSDMEDGSSNNDNSGNNPPEEENNNSADDDVENNPPADGGSDNEGPADMQ